MAVRVSDPEGDHDDRDVCTSVSSPTPTENILEFGYMDPVAAEPGPEAFMDQQAG